MTDRFRVRAEDLHPLRVGAIGPPISYKSFLQVLRPCGNSIMWLLSKRPKALSLRSDAFRIVCFH